MLFHVENIRFKKKKKKESKEAGCHLFELGHLITCSRIIRKADLRLKLGGRCSGQQEAAEMENKHIHANCVYRPGQRETQISFQWIITQ